MTTELSPAAYLRLEALRSAVAVVSETGGSAKQVLASAREYYAFLAGDKEVSGPPKGHEISPFGTPGVSQ